MQDEAHAFCDDLTLARRILEDYAAPSAAQGAVREEILAFIEAHAGDAHRRTCVPGHLTASALLLDHEGEMAASGTALARLLLDEPLIAAPGDRLVLRTWSPMITAASASLCLDTRRTGFCQ